MLFLEVVFSTVHSQKLKYTFSILPLSNCPLSPGNGQLSKLHVNKAQFYLRVQKENPQCPSKCFIFWLKCILSPRKSLYLSIPEKLWGPPLHYFSGMDRYSDFYKNIVQEVHGTWS